MNVPAATIWLHKVSYSSFEPSIQCTAAGLQRSTILSTQRKRCLFSLKGLAGLRFFMGRKSQPVKVAGKKAAGNAETAPRLLIALQGGAPWERRRRGRRGEASN